MRPDAIDMVSKMHDMNFDVVMLTGDHWDVAKQICEAVAIPESCCHARLLPDEKLGWIHRTQTGDGKNQKKSSGVVMLGDGINGMFSCRFMMMMMIMMMTTMILLLLFYVK